jgi:hypothetical protein
MDATPDSARTHIESALSSVLAIYRNTGPDVKDANERHDFASAAIAQSNIAIAAALLEIAEAIREARDERGMPDS